MLTMMRSNQSKLTPPPPVPPRPNKTIVAEALAKSRRLSPIRALFATQPRSPEDIASKSEATITIVNRKDSLKKNNDKNTTKPIRTAPPPPAIKPKPLNGQNGQIPQPQVAKSNSVAMVFNPRFTNGSDNKVVRSVSDVSDEFINNKSRTIVYQSPNNMKTSKIEVNLSRKSSIGKANGLKRVESTKNERNLHIDKKMIHISTPTIDKQTNAEAIINGDNKLCVKINTSDDSVSPDICSKKEHVEIVDTIVGEPGPQVNKVMAEENLSPAEKLIDVLVHSSTITETIVQSSDKTTIIVSNKADEDNNNIFIKNNETLPSMDKQIDAASEKDTDTKEMLSNRKVQFNDNVNHEILIAELQSMREEQERLLKRQRKAPVDIYDNDDSESVNSELSRIHHSDWIEVANNGEAVRLSSCQIYIDNNSDEFTKSSSFSSSSSRQVQRAPSMSSLHGLPPLPKSLSGFNLLENSNAPPSSQQRIETPRGTYRVSASPGPQTPSRAGSSRGTTPPTPGSGSGHIVYPPHSRVNGTSDMPRGRKITTLDTQLAILRREMYGLRQLDLSLLSQLYSLNEAIQDFRQILQDQEDSALSPHSPSPSPSSGDEGDEFYSPAPVRFKPAPPAPPLRRTSNSSSANSSEYGTV